MRDARAVSLDPRFERVVLPELALWERRARRRHGPDGARALAQRLHMRSVGLTNAELSALELLAATGSAARALPLLDRMRTLSKAPGSAGYLARVVARAAIEDQLDGARPVGGTLTALSLLPDPRLAT
jgi:hypothetical protein